MLPRVILSNVVSADGRTVGFPADIGLYYDLASRWNVDAHLAGSNTLLSAISETVEEGEEAFQPQETDPNDPRPLLAVPDSRGRLRNWHVLRKAGLWRGMVAICSRFTPQSYLDYLKQRHIDCIIAGDDHVNMRAALEELNARYGVEMVHLDSGGVLSGVLLRAGLVDEVNLLIHPCLAGGTAPGTMFHEPDSTTTCYGLINLKLMHLEQMRDEIVWLRYEVVRQTGLPLS